MKAQKGAPAACKLTGATDNSFSESLLVDDTTNNNSLLDGYPPVGTPEQAASALQLGITTVRQMCREGRLPSFKAGAQWRIPKAWLCEFMRGGGNG
jgi:excisionase family DNA binding protein